jgi:hypothetical protein
MEQRPDLKLVQDGCVGKIALASSTRQCHAVVLALELKIRVNSIPTDAVVLWN